MCVMISQLERIILTLVPMLYRLLHSSIAVTKKKGLKQLWEHVTNISMLYMSKKPNKVELWQVRSAFEYPLWGNVESI